MNEKEFEERQLTKLISDLRDINSYTSFKNGAYIYDLGHYQGLLLVNEIERLNKELESWIKLIDYKGIEDIPQYVSDLEVDNKQLKEENQLLNKNYNIINELEKCIKERITKTKIEPIREKERNRILYNLNVIYNKLQELKGSDKE